MSSLSGCIILDLSRLLPGPYCSMILADHGARVIAIEDRRFEKDVIPYLNSINRNKEHMTLNLKTGAGREIFMTLARKADVILEGFRPGAADRLGIGYQAVKEVNPDVIYCSITGYGQTGRLKHLAGHDVNFAGYSGVLSLIGPKEGPPCIPGVQIGDMIGGLNAAIGILLAMNSRTATGKGQYIDVSMTDSLFALLPVPIGLFQMTGQVPSKSDSVLSHRYACYQVYQTKDGNYLTVGALEPRFWEKLCQHFGVPEFIPLQYSDERRKDIIEFFQTKFLEKTRDEWEQIVTDIDACIGSILTTDEVLDSDWVRDREMITSVGGCGEVPETVIGIPIKFSETPGKIRKRPYRFGEHTHGILSEIGYSEKDIVSMAEQGII